MRPFQKKCCALLVGMSVMTSLVPTNRTSAISLSSEIKQKQNAETVYVGFIKDGERSTLFNQDWRFYKGDQAGAEAVDFNDSSWRSLSLPHDWSIEGDFTVEGEAESGFLLGGTGWYRKHFVVPEKYEGKEFTINFDGVYMNAEVYVNGKLVGEHNYGYTAFAFDITDELICDGETENIIAVKVKNPIPSSRWYSGSGIYRDVTLTVTDSIHVSHLGTTVTTPEVESQKGGNVDVVVETIVENESDNNNDIKLKTTVVNSNGEAVSNPVETTENIVANGSFTFKQTAVVNNPILWSVDNPNMYKVKNEVIVNDKVVDTYYVDFGFRYFNFDRDTGFSLNGENMKLKGVCMHHDQGALGAASYYRAVERQMEIMKEMGVNAIRVTHNPASQMLLEICDRLGLLVINEAFDTWTNSKNGNVNDFAKFFNTPIEEGNQIINGEPGMSWGEFEAREMVKTSINNPSVIMWSIGNEVLEGIGGDSSNYATIAENIVNWIQDEDTTRPVTIGDNKSKGLDNRAIAISDVIANNGGIVGFNYANENQFNSLRNSKSNWILYGSETSSAVHSRGYYKVRNHNNESRRDLQLPEFDNNANKVGWGHSASDAWKYTIKHDYNAGEFVWTGFDYIGEPTPWNGTGTGTVGGGVGAAPKSSYFGIVDTAGFEKDVYYLYQSQWNDDVNTLHVLPTWNEEDIPVENGNVQVDVFTDAYRVELYVNGKLIGTKTATENITDAGYKYYTFENDSLYPSFIVPYEAGTIEAKGYDKEGNLLTNTEGRSSVTTYGEVSTVDLSADKTTISADGYDLSYITVDLVDANGNIASGANNRLTYTLEGNGKIVGLDNGNAADTDRYKPATDKSGTRSAFSGKALVIVQSTRDAGEMTLTVSGEGLESKSITINTVNTAGDNKYIESYDIVKDYYVSLEEKPLLPKEVTARYSDGTTETLKVDWNEYDEAQLSAPQIFKVTGKLSGTDIAVVVNVHVIGDVVSMENVSTFTYSGNTPTLPKTVKGYLANGTESEEFVVNWNLDGLDFSTENTNVTVPGTVELLEETYNVIANVRVVPALKAARNLAINNSSENDDIPTLSQSCVVTADNLNSINNGITNGGENVNERWTNWNERNLTGENGEPKGAYVQFDWNNKYDIDRLDLWLFTDNLSARIPKKVEISYKNENGEYVVAPHTNTTEVSHAAGETTYFLNEVINTDSIRIYIQQPQVGNCIGLTEVKVYEYVVQENAKTTNTLTEIKIDGKALENFDPTINEYSINLEKLPELVEATSEENAALTILPIHNNKSTIVVRAEDGSKNIYTVNYVLPAPKEYTVTVNKTEGGSIAGTGKYVEGQEATLVATANKGYNFIGWFDEDGKEVSKDATYRFIVSSDVVLNAKFEKIPEAVDPSDPTDPETPSNPENPSNPEEPTEPSDPSDPNNPEKPVNPSDPGNQGGSNNQGNVNEPSDSNGSSNDKLPSTGSVVSSTQILVISLVLVGVGIVILRKRKYELK
ncbi:glycoside hydrolase family 2 TIM barrel-domain containing protein [Clostridium sp. D46t1_190503_E9]|uniref:glycoside hydrolase family 2 TIM barrel-domain containing protein n=1 Tax=Clostridium sp. D46t1_190503_E9 TaxID=2787137 RepID=UPI00189837A1|nr:glycoside hydrolase family 2 TIM barrel-domain containing protein [Clostridium sp. D46t1_190503_E9]